MGPHCSFCGTASAAIGAPGADSDLEVRRLPGGQVRAGQQVPTAAGMGEPTGLLAFDWPGEPWLQWGCPLPGCGYPVVMPWWLEAHTAAQGPGWGPPSRRSGCGWSTGGPAPRRRAADPPPAARPAWAPVAPGGSRRPPGLKVAKGSPQASKSRKLVRVETYHASMLQVVHRGVHDCLLLPTVRGLSAARHPCSSKPRGGRLPLRAANGAAGWECQPELAPPC